MSEAILELFGVVSPWLLLLLIPLYFWSRVVHKSLNSKDTHPESFERTVGWLRENSFGGFYLYLLGWLIDSVSRLLGDQKMIDQNNIISTQSRSLVIKLFGFNPLTSISFDKVLRLAFIYPLASLVFVWGLGGAGNVGEVDWLLFSYFYENILHGLDILLFLCLVVVVVVANGLLEELFSGWRKALFGFVFWLVFFLLFASFFYILDGGDGDLLFLLNSFQAIYSVFIIALMVFSPFIVGVFAAFWFFYGRDFVLIRGSALRFSIVFILLPFLMLLVDFISGFSLRDLSFETVYEFDKSVFLPVDSHKFFLAFVLGYFLIFIFFNKVISVLASFYSLIFIFMDFVFLGSSFLYIVFSLFLVGVVAVFLCHVILFFRRSGLSFSFYVVLFLLLGFWGISQSQSVEFVMLLLFWLILPLVNAPLDWLSLGVTRGLLQAMRSGHHKGLGALGFAAVDLLLALVFLFLITAVLVGVTALGNAVAGKTLVDIHGILSGIKGSPASVDHWWIYFMLLSTLVPTLIHFALAGGAATLWLPRKWRLQIADGLERDVHKTFAAWAYLTFTPVVGFIVVPGLLLYCLWWLVTTHDAWLGMHLLNWAQMLADFANPQVTTP